MSRGSLIIFYATQSCKRKHSHNSNIPQQKMQKKIAPKEKKFGNFYLLLYLEEIWF